MSEDNLNAINSSFENTSIVQAQQDAFASFMAIPVTKLDADQYLVADLDGITEGLFGSGNMNFLMMQSGQTNESMHAAGLLDMVGGNDLFAASLPILTGGGPTLGGSNNDHGGYVSLRGDHYGDQTFMPSDGAAFSNTIGTMGASNIGISAASSMAFDSSHGSSNVANPSTGTPTNGSNGTLGSSGAPGTAGDAGTSGSNGNNGSNGSNGNNGTGGPGDTITNIVNNTTNNVTDIVDNTVTNIFDTVNNVTDLVDNTVTNIFDTINNVTNNVTEIVTNVTDIVENIITNIFDILNGGGNGVGPIGIDLSATLDNITNLDLDIISGDQIFDVINEIIDLSPILTPLDDLLGDLSAGVDLGLILNPFQYDSDPNDHDILLTTDLNILGLDVVNALDGLHIPLDPVEALLGDIDLDLNVASGLVNSLLGGNSDDTDVGVDLSGVLNNLPIVEDLGVLDLLNDVPILADIGLDNVLENLPLLPGAENILLNPVEDLLGDVDLNLVLSLDLFNTSNIDNAAGDTDIVIPIDINIAGHNILNETIGVNLDIVESITGDIDLDLTVATDLLGNTADNLLDSITGGTGNDTLLSQIGSNLSDIVSNLLPDTGDENLIPSIGLDDIGGDLVSGGLLDLDLDFVDSLFGEADITAPVTALLSDDLIVAITDTLDDLSESLDILEVVLGGDESPAANLVESVLGSIEDTISGALNILDNAPNLGGLLGTDGLIANDNDGEPGGMWTESILPDVGDIFGGGLGMDITNILPDPISNSALAPLASAPVVGDVLGGLGLGGGGRHFGGLFG
jgi:hypothetical protein